jgi:lactate dehydrogenase-like 2-hydroxyacid dehydrogenase
MLTVAGWTWDTFFGSTLIVVEQLRKSKMGSGFINIPRGSVVDEDPLVVALTSGHVFAAGLDVHVDLLQGKALTPVNTHLVDTKADNSP